ncbi:hypothetical protein DSECCO2_446770 [anaerobic digester metagenome]
MQGCRPRGKNTWFVFVARPVLLKNKIHQGIDTSPAFVPDTAEIERNNFNLNLFPVNTVEVKHRGNGSLADNGKHIDAKIVENQTGAAHGGNVKTTPAGRKSGEYQPV